MLRGLTKHTMWTVGSRTCKRLRELHHRLFRPSMSWEVVGGHTTEREDRSLKEDAQDHILYNIFTEDVMTHTYSPISLL